jgi:hypothetical protein
LLANKEAHKHKDLQQELDNMQARIARDLADAGIAGLSADEDLPLPTTRPHHLRFSLTVAHSSATIEICREPKARKSRIRSPNMRPCCPPWGPNRAYEYRSKLPAAGFEQAELEPTRCLLGPSVLKRASRWDARAVVARFCPAFLSSSRASLKTGAPNRT